MHLNESTIEVAGQQYGAAASLELRSTMIELRNGALSQNEMGWAVTLSHVIAWMAVMIKATWPGTELGIPSGGE